MRICESEPLQYLVGATPIFCDRSVEEIASADQRSEEQESQNDDSFDDVKENSN